MLTIFIKRQPWYAVRIFISFEKTLIFWLRCSNCCWRSLWSFKL